MTISVILTRIFNDNMFGLYSDSNDTVFGLY